MVRLVKTRNTLLANILQCGMSDMGMNAFEEKEQGQVLTEPASFCNKLHQFVTVQAGVQ